jgi:hypothetical protein
MKTIILSILFLFTFFSLQAQEVFPGGVNGVGGSYNLTLPAGTCFIGNRPIGNNNKRISGGTPLCGM